MIYLTGDTHGLLDIGKLQVFFDKKSQETSLTKDDYLIILGDVGVCFDGWKNDNQVISILQSLPVTVLWIDGNHENHELLESFPVTRWHGGNVHMIENDIIHLMRGYVFTIEGLKFFTMGGAYSRDKMYRVEGISWWDNELPSKQEMETGRFNLACYFDEVDYVLTHTPPYEIVRELGYEIVEDEEEFLLYLQDLADNIKYKCWLSGHMHIDRKIGKCRLVYDKIFRINNEKR